jgi:hypothetical protein
MSKIVPLTDKPSNLSNYSNHNDDYDDDSDDEFEQVHPGPPTTPNTSSSNLSNTPDEYKHHLPIMGEKASTQVTDKVNEILQIGQFDLSKKYNSRAIFIDTALKVGDAITGFFPVVSNIYSTLAKFASLQISYYDLKHTIIDFLSLLYKYNNSLIKYLKLVQTQIEIEKDDISNNINNPSIQQNTIDLEGIASLIKIITIKIENNISYLDTIYDISSIDKKYQEMDKKEKEKKLVSKLVSKLSPTLSKFFTIVSKKITGFKTYSLFQSPEKINVNIQSMELELINNIILLLIEINSYLYKKQIPQKPSPLLNEPYEQTDQQKELDELDKQSKQIKSLLENEETKLDNEETKLEELSSANLEIEKSNITSAKKFVKNIMDNFGSMFRSNQISPTNGVSSTNSVSPTIGVLPTNGGNKKYSKKQFKRKLSKRKYSKRKLSKRKHSKRKHSKRKHSKRKLSKRKHSKKQFKRKQFKRKHSKRNKFVYL